MADEPKIYGRRWRVVRTLGKGGQGVVYQVEDTNGAVFDPMDLGEALSKFERGHSNSQERAGSAREIVDLLKLFLKSENLPPAALKELLPIDEAVNAKTALERMKFEIDTITTVTHPSLIRVLDSRIEERWFVTEYFKNGPLSTHLGRFDGHVRNALQAFRSVVEAVARLHANNIVHRDIKPENVFVADDGHLVLGDCGLAIKMEKQERLTLTFENVGTRDYQPPWSYGMRLEDVKPNFDVFSLGKLLWAMVSGKPRFPLWYFDRDPHDLRTLLPDNPDVLFVQRILEQCVVERSEHCSLRDGTALLRQVDQAIQALNGGAIIPTTTGKMRCRFCGTGVYQAIAEDKTGTNPSWGAPRKSYSCTQCGHLETFMFGNQAPPAWGKS
jgi:serine/threonine protein kinase